MGYASIKVLEKEEGGLMMALKGGKIAAVPLEEVLSNKRTLDMELVEMAKILS
jgi:6-phosphofructokinase 1